MSSSEFRSGVRKLIRREVNEKRQFEVIKEDLILSCVISPTDLLDVSRVLRDTEPYYFLHLSDITAVDYPKEKKRFVVFYQFYSFKQKKRLRLAVKIKEKQSLPSLTSLWASANWLERECYDMFGIQFESHPNLKKILMPEKTVSHPLRKDYPFQPAENISVAEKVETASPESDEI